VEAKEVLLERVDFLLGGTSTVKIKQLLEVGSEISSVDTNWVDSSLTFCKCWQDESDKFL
jgi:hypothetical protein